MLRRGVGVAGLPNGRRTMVAALLLALSTASGAVPVVAEPATLAGKQADAITATQLLMVDDLGCPYCARWDAEVGGGYGNSAEGRFAPMIRIRRGDSRLERFKAITYTPTFIVLHNGDEVGRITGYPGAHFFWPMLEEILRKTGYSPPKAGG